MAEETNHKPYRLGLALSGGGAKGFAHIGVFRMMEECALRPDIIVGTSAGALTLATFANPTECPDNLDNNTSIPAT